MEAKMEILACALIVLLKFGCCIGAASVQQLKEANEVLVKQAIMQQMQTEERLRSSFASGLTSVPQTTSGTDPYHTESGQYLLPQRNYANFEHEIGMGPFTALLNGNSFQSMQSSYRLVKPDAAKSDYNAVVDIDFPEVPKEVTSKRSVAEQVAEMKEWFKAWGTQNQRLRPYKPYFKALLCYLEGAWVNLDNNVYDKELMRRNQQSVFSAYTGYEDPEEKVAFTPTTILKMGPNDVPLMAKWDSRILCHPLDKDLPTKALHLIDNFMARVDNKLSMDKLRESNAARYQLNPDPQKPYKDQHHTNAFLDKIFKQIPGKDGYGAKVTDSTFGYDSNDVDGGTLNAAYYHRYFNAKKVGAMGLLSRHRGWNDQNVFMAKNTQSKVAMLEAEHRCNAKTGKCDLKAKSRWSYAVAMEVVYLTPLAKWNPHGVSVKPNQFYMTPYEFFSGPEVNPDPADSVREFIETKDRRGRKVKLRGSGIRIILPEIEGVGKLRQRYNIMPLDVDGTAEWKELQALLDATLDFPRYKFRIGMKADVLEGRFHDDSAVDTAPWHMRMLEVPAVPDELIINHGHDLLLDGRQVKSLKDGTVTSINATAALASGHYHSLVIEYNAKTNQFFYTKCDKQPPGEKCDDGHERRLKLKF